MGNVSFAGGNTIVPSCIRRSEIDNIVAGLGCGDDSEVVTGAIWSDWGWLTAIGEVVLGKSIESLSAESELAMLMSSRFNASLGAAGEGITSAPVGFCLSGGTIDSAGTFGGVQIDTVGTGISSGGERF